jgi:amidase
MAPVADDCSWPIVACHQPPLAALSRHTGQPKAVAAHQLARDQCVDEIARDNLRYVPFTELANLTGTPAMSVPLYWTADGLPMGVQFVAAFWKEDRLLQLAHQLEVAQPWFHRLPNQVAV